MSPATNAIAPATIRMTPITSRFTLVVKTSTPHTRIVKSQGNNYPAAMNRVARRSASAKSSGVLTLWNGSMPSNAKASIATE